MLDTYSEHCICSYLGWASNSAKGWWPRQCPRVLPLCNLEISWPWAEFWGPTGAMGLTWYSPMFLCFWPWPIQTLPGPGLDLDPTQTWPGPGPGPGLDLARTRTRPGPGPVLGFAERSKVKDPRLLIHSRRADPISHHWILSLAVCCCGWNRHASRQLCC